MNDDGTDTDRLRREVRDRYRDVALRPDHTFDLYTGQPLAERLGYPRSIADALPDRAIESFAGIGNPFALRPLQPGQNVTDVSKAGARSASIGLAVLADVAGITSVYYLGGGLLLAAAATGLIHLRHQDIAVCPRSKTAGTWPPVHGQLLPATANRTSAERADLCALHRPLRSIGKSA